MICRTSLFYFQRIYYIIYGLICQGIFWFVLHFSFSCVDLLRLVLMASIISYPFRQVNKKMHGFPRAFCVKEPEPYDLRRT